MSLRILHVVPVVPSGGTSSFIAQEVEGLVGLGVVSEYVFFAGSTMLMRPYRLIGGILAIRRAIKNFQPDVVHAHWGSLLAFASAVSTIAGPPLVITFHGSDINPVPSEAWARSLLRLTCTHLATLGADAIICVSEELKGRLWSGQKRARVIMSGTDLRRFVPSDRMEARRLLSWAKDASVVLFNAGISPQVKRLDLAEASIVHARRRIGGLRFEVLRGEVPFGDVPLRLNAADCLLVTSDFEGSPNIVREAIACGTPVVSVPVGDVLKWLKGLPGTRIVDRDPVKLGEAVADLIESGIRPVPGALTEKFSNEKSCREVLDVYLSLTGEVAPQLV